MVPVIYCLLANSVNVFKNPHCSVFFWIFCHWNRELLEQLVCQKKQRTAPARPEPVVFRVLGSVRWRRAV